MIRLCPHEWLRQRPHITVVRYPTPKHITGLWYPDLQTIVLDVGLTPGIERDTLAHEIAHILRGDPYGDPLQEQKADELAQLLFGPYLEPLAPLDDEEEQEVERLLAAS